jgi:hypothetical protein
MKSLLFILTLCFSAGVASGQLVNKPPQMMEGSELGQYYLKKSKNQKTWGWIMLATSAGFYVAANAALKDEKVYTMENSTGKVLFLMGTGALVGSIPLFSNSSRNKGRADILLNMEKGPVGYMPSTPSAYPSIGVGISIGRK